MRLSLERIAEFSSASGDFNRHDWAEGYSIDSRSIKPGELFFAIKGERLDGHEFVTQALANGAIAAVVDKAHAPALKALATKLLVVADTIVALQTVASAARRLWNHTLIGVTGSAGKTTTKEAIAHVLSRKYRVLKSEGNLNNHFGLPLQLLKLQPEHQIAVIEMGMNHAGEITALAKIARPDSGVVTNVAPVHLEFFDSICDIARAKFELIQSLPAGALAVLNADDEYVSQFGRDFHGTVLTYGITKPADVRAENICANGTSGTNFDLVVESTREPVSVPLLGEHNVRNCLAAAACGFHYHLTPSEIAQALSSLKPVDKRGEMLILRGATVINDCYNSNPTALKSMVKTLAALPAKRRIVVAGEMLELGPTGEQLHRECGEFMSGKVDILLGVRGLAQPMVEAAKVKGVRAEFVATPEEAGAWLERELQDGDAVLLKASRGVRLEKALATFGEKIVAH
jgi:UDP-N-acetylmuramoyl-tripeptide--D-alanyl-D-alanine ligase